LYFKPEPHKQGPLRVGESWGGGICGLALAISVTDSPAFGCHFETEGEFLNLETLKFLG
jgi:hypothetical protein